MAERRVRDSSACAQAGILAVDDYPPNLVALTALLEPLGRRLVTVTSGEAALQALAREDFTVAILDVNMPGLGGLDVARRVRGFPRNSTVPIIFLTASEADASAALAGYAAGAVDYVRKPFDPAVLRSKIATFVELHDRREEVRREAALRMNLEAERAATARESRAKDEFLSVLSHELRTPLTSILLWTEMLVSRNLPPETVSRAHRMIDRCARAEAHMVENVLEMSHIATGTFTVDLHPIDIVPVIEAAVEEVRTVHGRDAIDVARPAAAVPRVNGDANRLAQVVFNLVDNAVKFTSGPAGGEVTVAIAADPATVFVRVSDTGPGISEDVRGRLFQRFRPGDASKTRPHGGLGLGLAVAYAVATAHGGSLEVRDRGTGGAGTVATLALPTCGERDA